MTNEQIKQAINQLPKEETFSRCYKAFEGGIRLISKMKDGYEVRYNVIFEGNNVRLVRF